MENNKKFAFVNIGMDGKYVKINNSELNTYTNTFIFTDTHLQETSTNQEDILINAKQEYVLKYYSEKIDKRILEDMNNDNMNSLITQTNYQPFYATLKPSKHKKTNKKKR